MLKVYKFDLEGNLIYTFKSIKEASIIDKVSPSRMYNAVRNVKRVKDFVYTTDFDYIGTVYTAHRGRPVILHSDGLTVKQACETLKISKFKVYDLLSKGKLKGVKTEGIWYITEDSLFNYLKEGR